MELVYYTHAVGDKYVYCLRSGYRGARLIYILSLSLECIAC